MEGRAKSRACFNNEALSSPSPKKVLFPVGVGSDRDGRCNGERGVSEGPGARSPCPACTVVCLCVMYRRKQALDFAQSDNLANSNLPQDQSSQCARGTLPGNKGEWPGGKTDEGSRGSVRQYADSHACTSISIRCFAPVRTRD